MSNERGMVLMNAVIDQGSLVGVLAQAFKSDAAVKLSVFKANPAKNLYTELGFKTYLETESTYEVQATV